jgi:hypothetical protein
MRKQGDVSRKRRLFCGEPRTRWYAKCRAARFAKRYSVVPAQRHSATAEYSPL